MALPVTFANLTAATLPMLDENFAALGALTTIPCAVGGTNTLVLTPAANTPTISAYNTYQGFSFVVASTNTGAVTATVGSLSTLAVYKDTASGPVALTGGELVDGNQVSLTYDPALNTGAGGFHMQLTAAVATVVAPATGAFRNLQIQGTGNTTVQVSAASVVLTNPVSGGSVATLINSSVSTSTTGLNALDSGSVAASTWYAVYAVASNITSGVVLTAAKATTGTTVGGSTSITSVASTTGMAVGCPIFGGGLPGGTFITSIVGTTITVSQPSNASGSGVALTFFPLPAAAITASYPYYARLGAVLTNSSSYILGTLQIGNKAQYVVGGVNITAAPQIASGSTSYSPGTGSTGDLTAAALAAFVPPSASVVRFYAYSNLGHTTVVAPNNSYGGDGSTSIPPPVANRPTTLNQAMPGNFEIETSNIYWGSDNSGNALVCLGWEDNL